MSEAACRAAQSRRDERTPGASGTCATVSWAGCDSTCAPSERHADRVDDPGWSESGLGDPLLQRERRLGGRALRPGSLTSSGSSPARRTPGLTAKDRLRCPGGAPARADGAGVCRRKPGRPPARRGRLPGRLPRAGQQGPFAPRSGVAGQLALRRRAGPPRQGRGSSIARIGVGTEEEGSARYVRPCLLPTHRPIGSMLSIVSRPRCCTREIDRLPKAFRLPVVLCYFEGLSLDEAAGSALPVRHALRSRPGPGQREAPGPRLARRSRRSALARRRAWPRSSGAPIGLGIRLIPPVRFHHPGRDRTSRPRHAAGGGACRRHGTGPGGPAYHAAPQAQAHRDVPACSWLPSPPGAGLARPLDGDDQEEPAKRTGDISEGPDRRSAEGQAAKANDPARRPDDRRRRPGARPRRQEPRTPSSM